MSSSIRENDRRHVWHPFTQAALAEPPIPVVRAAGALLHAEDGRTYIDAIASWWVNLHGHGHPAIARAVAEQAERLEHVIFAGFTHEPAASLAAELAGVLPGDLTRIFYSDNGSTAVEVGLKIALQLGQRARPARTRIVALEDSYHGDTFGAMAVSARDAFTAPFFPYLFPVTYVPAPVPGREAEALDALRRACAPGDVAAFVYEPLVQGAGGMRIMEPGALEPLLAEARAAGALLLADEVMTGFGRTGPLFASSSMATAPDLVALSKGLTGGAMAMGVTAASETTYRAFWSTDLRRTMFHGHSFTANPLACAAARASLSLTLSQTCAAQRERLQHRHRAFLETVLRPHPRARDPRVLGTLLAFELTDGAAPAGGRNGGDPAYFHGWRDRIYRFFLDRGLLMRPLGNTVYLLPPYVITDGELDTAYGAMAELLEAAAAWPAGS